MARRCITYMADVTAMPANSFGSVPTPALVAPIEFTLPLATYATLGGFTDRVRGIADVLAETHARSVVLPPGVVFPVP